MELHVDIKIEREGKGQGLFDRRQAIIGVACRYKDRERGGKGKGKGYMTGGRQELELDIKIEREGGRGRERAI